MGDCPPALPDLPDGRDQIPPQIPGAAGQNRPTPGQAPFRRRKPPGAPCRPGADAGMQGAKPLAKNNFESPPSPPGKGVGGWGQKHCTSEGRAGNAEYGHPEKNAASRPVRRAAPGADAGVPGTLPEAVPPPAQSQGCKGRSPLQKKNFESPPSPPGKGVGGMGQKGAIKGRVNRRRRERTLPPLPGAQGKPETPGVSPPAPASCSSKVNKRFIYKLNV